jgi:hypothetical protein
MLHLTLVYVFKYYNYMIVFLRLLPFLVCEGDCSAYGVRDFIGEYVILGLVEFAFLHSSNLNSIIISLIDSLTHGAEPFLRSCQLCS